MMAENQHDLPEQYQLSSMIQYEADRDPDESEESDDPEEIKYSDIYLSRKSI